MTLLCSMDTRRHLHLALAKTPPYLDSDWKWLKENYCANYSRPNQTARKLDLRDSVTPLVASTSFPKMESYQVVRSSM
jgi:hypothetical protein